MHRNLRLFIGAGLATLMLSGSAYGGVQDAWITTKAKLALMTTEGVGATSVNVDTVGNQVTLHGKVSSDAEKQKAQAVVSKIDGVKGVRNLLQVVPPSAEDRVALKDDELKDRVDKALAADKSLSDSDIDVKSVNDGIVMLSGNAKSLTDHLRAVEITARVPGVHRVVTQIEGPDKFASREIYVNEKDAHDTSISGTARDAWITSAVKMVLLADGDTPALDINVDTQDGVVTLFGIVPSQPAKDAATADARKVAGVKDVRNQIEIVPAKKAEAVEVKDDQVQDKVKVSLGQRKEFEDVTVEVSNGVARLSGKVPGPEDRLEAAIIARSTGGVRAVRDDLTIAD